MKKSDLIITGISLLLVIGIFGSLHYVLDVRPRREAERMKLIHQISMNNIEAHQDAETDRLMAELKKQFESMRKLDEQIAKLERLTKPSEVSQSAFHRQQSMPIETQVPASVASKQKDSGLRVFDGDGHSKANGLRFRISYPSYWIAAEGTRPHIVHKFSAPENAAVFIIQLLPLTREISAALKQADRDYLYSKEGCQQFLPSGGKITSSQRTKLDGEECGMFESSLTAERAGVSLLQKNLTFVIITKQGILLLVGSVGSLPGQIESIDDRFAKFKSHFVAIAGSLHLPDKWAGR